MKYGIVVPVYKNAESIGRLMRAVSDMNTRLGGELEVVFVVDGSPDRSFEMLKQEISTADFTSRLIGHSRNFGSFAAIRTGLIACEAEYMAVMAADLQEPPTLILDFFRSLAGDECDVAIGVRTGRADPLVTRFTASLFWGLYRRFVVPEMPMGGVDIFGCNRTFRDHLIRLNESRSSLVALIFWLGFRRKMIGYERQSRQEGKSSWTLGKKVSYMMDSIFAFTDLPIRILIQIGTLGSLASLLMAMLVFAAKVSGLIPIPGYAATMLVVLLLGTLNLLGLGLVGTYAWRAYENSKGRPTAVVAVTVSNCLDDGKRG